MRYIFILWFAIFSQLAIGQVGISTSNPKASLDVNGDFNVRREIRVGGTNTTIGNAGTIGQVLVSNGASSAPSWKSLNVPLASNGDYQLVNTTVLYDEVGIDFGQNTNNTATSFISVLGDDISSAPVWTPIAGLQSSIVTEQEGNTLSLIFQTGVESSSAADITDNRLVKYMCGVFQNNKLVAFRGDELLDVHRKSNNNEGVFTLSYSVDNLAVGTHVFRVACRRIQTTLGTYRFTIGRNILGSTISNAFMLSSVMKIELLEPVVYP